jgi:pSer/pThr/pTyr-binding forkhead associated (FHA) protein
VISFNGTYINGVRVGRNDRKMLRHGDEIQLFKKSAYSDSDPRLKCKLLTVGWLCTIKTEFIFHSSFQGIASTLLRSRGN